MRQEIYTEKRKCDICGKTQENEYTTKNPKRLVDNETDDIISVKYPVWFVTEQTEGRSINPYLDENILDLCRDCIKKVIKIRGSGAQGYNHYSLIQDSEK